MTCTEFATVVMRISEPDVTGSEVYALICHYRTCQRCQAIADKYAADFPIERIDAVLVAKALRAAALAKIAEHDPENARV